MKKIFFILALAVATLSVSYAYPPDQEISRTSSTFIDFQSNYKYINANCTGTMHYYLEIKNYGKAFIKVWSNGNPTHVDMFTWPVSTVPIWKPGEFSFNNEYISYVQVEVQIDPQKPNLVNFASTRWEW